MSVHIVGLGISPPPFSIQRERSIEFAKSLLHNPGKEARALPALYRMTNVNYRGSVLLEGEDQDVVAEQTFYPDADSSEQRGPTTRVRLDRFQKEALPLAQRASEAAIADAAIDPKSITISLSSPAPVFIRQVWTLNSLRILGYRWRLNVFKWGSWAAMPQSMACESPRGCWQMIPRQRC